MKSKDKKCQNCDKAFTIDASDFEFYKKIDVPEPTFCPECRMQRRMAWRKEAPIFYKNKCEATDKEIISSYNPNGPIKVFNQEYWFSDKWDPMDEAQEYDFKENFFQQFQKLLHKVPQPATTNDDATKSDYCNDCNGIKECYLTTNSGYGERLAFCNRTVDSKDCYDLFVTTKLELCYQNVYCKNSYKLFFSDHCDGCVESYFLYDCRNCEQCFGCTNLRHKKYHIFNKPYSREEYFEKLKGFDVGSFKELEKLREKYKGLYYKAIHRFAHIVKSTESTGNEIGSSKRCQNCFDVQGCENLKYVTWAGFGYPLKDSYDCGPGVAAAELAYEGINTGLGGVKNMFVIISWYNHHVEYSYNCRNSEYLFGCVGLRNKKYCILNRQYTKEEYEKLVPKIKQQLNVMPYKDKKGNIYKYGEFFPAEMSPYNYDETIAQEIFPLAKNEIKEYGYIDFERPKNKYKATIKNSELPDNIKDVDNSILNEIIECEHNSSNKCLGSGVFKLISRELEFYRKQNLPLPRLCPVCRHNERIKLRNPMKLQERQCMCGGEKDIAKTYQNQAEHNHGDKPCSNKFKTSYAPNRKEIVYCEECYQREVE